MQNAYFTAVYVFKKRVDINGIFHDIYELLCKYINLLAGWLPEGAVYNKGHFCCLASAHAVLPKILYVWSKAPRYDR